jgi:hypothetical protein
MGQGVLTVEANDREQDDGQQPGHGGFPFTWEDGGHCGLGCCAVGLAIGVPRQPARGNMRQIR